MTRLTISPDNLYCLILFIHSLTHSLIHQTFIRDSQVVLVVKNLHAKAGDIRDADSGRSPGERNGKLLQYSCLEDPKDRGSWWVTVHGVAASDLTDVT